MLGKVLGFACGGGRDCFLFLNGLLLPISRDCFQKDNLLATLGVLGHYTSLGRMVLVFVIPVAPASRVGEAVLRSYAIIVI